jgi:hypothetical protein
MAVGILLFSYSDVSPSTHVVGIERNIYGSQVIRCYKCEEVPTARLSAYLSSQVDDVPKARLSALGPPNISMCEDCTRPDGRRTLVPSSTLWRWRGPST